MRVRSQLHRLPMDSVPVMGAESFYVVSGGSSTLTCNFPTLVVCSLSSREIGKYGRLFPYFLSCSEER